MAFPMTFGPKNKVRMTFHKKIQINKSNKKFLDVKHVLPTSVKINRHAILEYLNNFSFNFSNRDDKNQPKKHKAFYQQHFF